MELESLKNYKLGTEKTRELAQKVVELLSQQEATMFEVRIALSQARVLVEKIEEDMILKANL